MKSGAVRLCALGIAVGLVSTSCGGAGANGDGETPSTEVTSDSEPPVVGDANQWALDYTGGTSGIATGDPIKFGYVNSEADFPESTVGLNAAVAFVNAELGGAAGRPLEVVPCPVASPEDAVTCGSLLAADPAIVAVVTGGLRAGNAELYAALGGIKPMIVGDVGVRADFDTTVGKSFTASLPGTAVGMAHFVITQLDAVEKVAIVVNDSESTRLAGELFVRPVLQRSGVVTSLLELDQDDPAAARTVVESIDDDADVIILLSTIRGCSDIRSALDDTDTEIVVVTTMSCTGEGMADASQDRRDVQPAPNGWYFADHGFNPYQPDVASGMSTFLSKIQQYGVPIPGAATVQVTGLAGSSFANVLTLTKFINQLGVDALDFTSVDTAIRGFSGPMMMQAGPIDCDGLSVAELPPLVSVCASQIGVQQFLDGRWQSVTDALNGRPIDLLQ